jgi:group I intron endonuclease
MLVYLIRNRVTGEGYVGQTSTSLARRFNAHCWNARRSSNVPSLLREALRTYGRDAFEISALGEFPSGEAADVAEELFIIALGTLAPDGYNMRHGGVCGPHTEFSRARMRGKPKSAEAIEKRSAALRGRPATAQQRENLARGRAVPQEPKAGEKNGRAVLTDSDVREIRRRFAAGGISQQALADEYGVHQTAISKIVRRRAWSHLADEPIRPEDY